MNNKETKKDSSIFELIEIRYGYYDDEDPPQYPSFEVNRNQIGHFTTLTKAEQVMRKGEVCGGKYTFGFSFASCL